MKEIPRKLKKDVQESLSSMASVYIAGPRQAGKTTLAKNIAKQNNLNYITFDDIQFRSSAKIDPEAFLKSINKSVILDEVQMVPEIFRPLKIIIDNNRNITLNKQVKFLLTGSANIMALPKLADALVGRTIIHTLMPLSMLEITNNINLTFIDKVFTESFNLKKIKNTNIAMDMTQASFPELYALKQEKLKYEWCNSYLNTILQRDVSSILEIEKTRELPNMLQLLATRTGGTLNESAIANSLGLNHITSKRYRLLLESLFLTQSIPAWTNNIGKRLVKSPKIYINDINILAYLLNINLNNISSNNPVLFGHILENFVAIELLKQITFSNSKNKLFHYRTSSGQEIDFLIEGVENKIVGIEVKSKTRVVSSDFKHLKSLADTMKNKFHKGIVLYLGQEILPFGEQMWAIPIQSLWSN